MRGRVLSAIGGASTERSSSHPEDIVPERGRPHPVIHSADPRKDQT